MLILSPQLPNVHCTVQDGTATIDVKINAVPTRIAPGVPGAPHGTGGAAIVPVAPVASVRHGVLGMLANALHVVRARNGVLVPVDHAQLEGTHRRQGRRVQPVPKADMLLKRVKPRVHFVPPVSIKICRDRVLAWIALLVSIAPEGAQDALLVLKVGTPLSREPQLVPSVLLERIKMLYRRQVVLIVE
jgi:hypothetical protein